jgi:hypothetical protein
MSALQKFHHAGICHESFMRKEGLTTYMRQRGGSPKCVFTDHSTLSYDGLTLRQVLEVDPKAPLGDPTPKTALTFAAVWVPGQGMKTFEGDHLLHDCVTPGLNASFLSDTSACNSSCHSDTSSEQTVEDGYFYDTMRHGHPDCEPHLVRLHLPRATHTLF